MFIRFLWRTYRFRTYTRALATTLRIRLMVFDSVHVRIANVASVLLAQYETGFRIFRMRSALLPTIGSHPSRHPKLPKPTTPPTLLLINMGKFFKTLKIISQPSMRSFSVIF